MQGGPLPTPATETSVCRGAVAHSREVTTVRLLTVGIEDREVKSAAWLAALSRKTLQGAGRLPKA